MSYNSIFSNCLNILSMVSCGYSLTYSSLIQSNLISLYIYYIIITNTVIAAGVEGVLCMSGCGLVFEHHPLHLSAHPGPRPRGRSPARVDVLEQQYEGYVTRGYRRNTGDRKQRLFDWEYCPAIPTHILPLILFWWCQAYVYLSLCFCYFLSIGWCSYSQPSSLRSSIINAVFIAAVCDNRHRWHQPIA